MEQRKRKKDDTGQLNLRQSSHPARNSAAPTRYSAAPPSGRPGPMELSAELPLRELLLGPKHIHARSGACWGPSRSSVTDSAPPCAEEEAAAAGSGLLKRGREAE
jgi:hypothetical protein